MGCRDGAVVRALASHQCGLGSISRSGIMWVEFVGSLLCTKRFSPDAPVSPLLKNQHLTWLDLCWLLISVCSVPNWCSSARMIRHLNKVPFLSFLFQICNISIIIVPCFRVLFCDLPSPEIWAGMPSIFFNFFSILCNLLKIWLAAVLQPFQTFLMKCRPDQLLKRGFTNVGLWERCITIRCVYFFVVWRANVTLQTWTLTSSLVSLEKLLAIHTAK